MNERIVDKITRAVLYEGYLLYPYRPSLKNRQRWTFGGVVPRRTSEKLQNGDAWEMRTECLVLGEGSQGERGQLVGQVRFLQPVLKEGVEWEAAKEREIDLETVSLGDLCASPREVPFSFPGLLGRVRWGAERLKEGPYKVWVAIQNLTGVEAPNREAAMRHALVSTHTVLGALEAEFISLMDPPAQWKAAAESCRNVGTWPILVGEKGEKDTLLSSPIILEDYPEIAPESPGDFFDGAEIDELLTLRVMTLTDEEKSQMRSVDEHARALLQRTEAMAPEDFWNLHGRLRKHEATLAPGSRVKIVPKGRSDIMDIALAGRTATIESVERDFEDRLYYAVTIDDDPGKELGVARMIGHRFFFSPEEVAPLE